MREKKNQSDKISASKLRIEKAVAAKRPPLSKIWSEAWKITSYRYKLWIGATIFLGILIAFPFFFAAIDARNGHLLTDIFLEWLPAKNVSIAVFFLIWSCCLLLVFRIIWDPMMLLTMLWAYNGVTLLRMACIGLISLNPPVGLIPLADPITNQFYGDKYITHDLFFSGHTTTVFLVFLCLKKPIDRAYGLFASILLGLLLLIQHVHYTIDVLAAPLFTWLVYRLAMRFTKRENELIFPAVKSVKLKK